MARIRIAAVIVCLLLPWAAAAQTLSLPNAGGAAYAVPVDSLKATRFKRTLRQQYDFSCGSAALATLLTHQYGYPLSEQAAFEFMYAGGDQAKIRQEGFSLLDMKRLLEARGFAADGFEAPLDKLAEAGLPAIVLIVDGGYHHFVVIKGLRGDRVLIGDPAKGVRTMARRDFEKLWPNRLLFVIHDSPAAPRFNAEADWQNAPLAPMAQGVPRGGLEQFTVPRFGPGEF